MYQVFCNKRVLYYITYKQLKSNFMKSYEVREVYCFHTVLFAPKLIKFQQSDTIILEYEMIQIN